MILFLDIETRSPVDLNACGAEVYFSGSDAAERQPTVERVAAERGMTAIDTWEEAPIPPGHGTIGLEIIEQFPEVERVLVPVSSGGMAAGIAAAIKLSRPEVEVIGGNIATANAASSDLRRDRSSSRLPSRR